MTLLLVAGFLGSGKTSLILPLAHHLVGDGSDPARRVVIVENEIGETPIDQKILGAAGYSVRELFAGCICCQLATDLTQLLNDLAEDSPPGFVIVEATGLAYPGKILDAVRRYARGIDATRTITVVDVERWHELLDVAPVLVERQVAEADVLIANKIDRSAATATAAAIRAAAALNPAAPVVPLCAHEPVPEALWPAILGTRQAR